MSGVFEIKDSCRTLIIRRNTISYVKVEMGVTSVFMVCGTELILDSKNMEGIGRFFKWYEED